MEKVTIDALEPDAHRDDIDHHGLTEPLGATDVSINRYRLEPDSRLSSMHAHGDQEEVFLVLEGDLVFETLDGEVDVGTGEAIRFAPGEYQSATNDSDREAVVYALGAPRGTEDIRIPLECPACGHEWRRPEMADDGKTPVLVCPGCGSTSEAICPNCGSDSMRAVLDVKRKAVVSRCRDCAMCHRTM